MATDKEKALVSEIVDLANGVNEAGLVDARVEIWSGAVQIRMSSRLIEATSGSVSGWIYYPDRAAYFSNDVFTEENFEYVAGTYIAELKKHHPQYDADGVMV